MTFSFNNFLYEDLLIHLSHWCSKTLHFFQYMLEKTRPTPELIRAHMTYLNTFLIFEICYIHEYNNFICNLHFKGVLHYFMFSGILMLN